MLHMKSLVEKGKFCLVNSFFSSRASERSSAFFLSTSETIYQGMWIGPEDSAHATRGLGGLKQMFGNSTHLQSPQVMTGRLFFQPLLRFSVSNFLTVHCDHILSQSD